MKSTQQVLSVETILQRLREELPRLREEYNVDQLSVFGSYARNTQNSESDVDILVTYRVVPGLVQYIQLEQHLSDILGAPVDLVMERALKPEIAIAIAPDKKSV
jgi:uncharacterized protein